MKYVIVTGMSGAGKSVALKMLEDAGFFCIDNLPMALVDKVAELALSSNPEQTGIALGLDVRSMRDRSAVEKLLALAEDHRYELLFLDAEDATLIRRYKETRRSHPLAKNGRISEGIDKEREILKDVPKHADYVIDTSRLLTRELRQELEQIFLGGREHASVFLTVLSFGFKYGIPADADLVFDVRFLPNPYYEEDLRHLTGEEERVQAFVLHSGTAERFEARWFDLMDFLIPHYVAEGKQQLVIAVGCTGGKHRSVTMASRLWTHLKQHQDWKVHLEHRDIAR